MTNNSWLTVVDVVEILHVHRQTVRRWIRSGELKGYDLAGRSGYRIRATDLEEFMENRAVEARITQFSSDRDESSINLM